MSHLSTERPFTCGTCDLEISVAPVFHVGLAFCCSGCAAGGPCICSYDEEVIDDERSGSQARRDDVTTLMFTL